MDRDQKFFDMYSLVIGALAIAALGIFVLAMKISDRTQEVYKRDGAEYQAAVAERIRPVGEVYLPGEEAAAAAPTAETVSEPEPVAAALSGPQVYNSACLACHEQNVAAHWKDSLHMLNNLSCVTCHDVHTGGDKVLFPAQQANVCTVCHKTQKKGIHGMEDLAGKRVGIIKDTFIWDVIPGKYLGPILAK